MRCSKWAGDIVLAANAALNLHTFPTDISAGLLGLHNLKKKKQKNMKIGVSRLLKRMHEKTIVNECGGCVNTLKTVWDLKALSYCEI